MSLGFTFILTAQQTLFQNNMWSITKWCYNSDIGTINPLPAPTAGVGYDGLPATNVSNAMQDANGDLLFFIVDNEIYDKEGYTIGDMNIAIGSSTYLKVDGTSEITIVPDPTNCSQYYIFMAGRNDYSGQASKIPVVAILDMSQPTDYGANLGKMGRILYCQTIQSVLPSSAPDFLISNSGKQGLTFFAASKEKEGKRFVFISSPARIFRFVIDANGFQYDGNIQFRDYSNPSTDFIVNTYDQIPYRGEMELIGIDNDTDVKYRIAVSMPMKYNDINAPNASSFVIV